MDLLPLNRYLFTHSFIYLKSVQITKQEQITRREQVSSMAFRAVSAQSPKKPVTKTYVHSSKWHFWFIVCDLKGIKILFFRLPFWRLRKSRTTTKNNPTNLSELTCLLEFLPKLKTHRWGWMYFLHKLEHVNRLYVWAGEGAKIREETAREEIVEKGKCRAPPLLLPAHRAYFFPFFPTTNGRLFPDVDSCFIESRFLTASQLKSP